MPPVAALYDGAVQPRRTLWWAILALVTVDLVFFSGASNYLAAPQSRILNQLIVIAAGLAAGVLAWRGRLDQRSPLVLPGVAFIATTALATLTSQRPEASREALALLLLAAPSYLLIRAIHAHPWFRARLDWLLILAGFGFTVAYLIQALSQWIQFWSVAGPAAPPLRPGDVGLTVGTVNAVSLYLELLVPIGLALAWIRWRSGRFIVLYGSLAIVAMVVTGSRGAWLGTMGGLAVAAGVIWLAGGRARMQRGAPRSGRRWLVVGVSALGVVAVIVLGPALLTRLAGGDAGRIELWSAAWSMFSANPLTGVGPGAWPGLRPLTPISADLLAVLHTSHSSVLQVLTELGIVGALAVGWLTTAVGWLGWRAIRSATTTAERTLRAACVASLVAFAVHSLVDVQVHIPAVALLLMLVVVRLDPAAERSAAADETPRPQRPLTGLALVAPAIVGAALLIPVDVAMIRAEFGNGHLDRGDAALARADFDAAIALHDLPVYRLGQAISRAGLADDAGALESLTAMQVREPFTFVLSARAALLSRAGTPELAEPLLAAVERAGSYDPTAILQVALIRSASGAGPTTTDDLAAVMVAVPSLIHSMPPSAVFDDATWSAAQHEALTRLNAIDPSVAAAEAIQAGLDADAALARALVMEPDRLALLVVLTVAVDGGTPDLERVDSILRKNASSPPVHQLAWAIGFAARSQPLIDRVARLSTVVSFAAPQAPMEIVLDGRSDADWSLRLPRYPNAASSRLGPDRPYLRGLATIEPVYRPKP